METKHTPGPWYEASKGNHQGLVISEADGREICVTYDKRDAPIIAAAPDMLAALQRALEICEDERDSWASPDCEQAEELHTLWTNRADEMRAAIAKATAS